MYAAIAAEALAAGHLDQEYSARLSGAVGPDIRIQEFSQARGTVVRKDPIYEALGEVIGERTRDAMQHLKAQGKRYCYPLFGEGPGEAATLA